jgi:hypothetical protein
LEKWLILRLEQETYKISSKCLTVLKSKELLKTKNKRKKRNIHLVGNLENEHWSKLRDLSMAKAGTI